MLEVQNISKHFGPIAAVRDVSFSVAKGQILGFLGPNGAGKSTTMRMITGFLPPTAGTARICGHDIREEPVTAKKHLGYLPENAPFYGEMTVMSFLRFIAELRGFRGAERGRKAEAAVETCRLQAVRSRPIGTLSKGYKQRVCFAQAVLHDPDVLIMDEPTDGLDPNQKHVVRSLIRSMAAEKTIVISTHILEEVDAICTQTIVINNGKLVAQGTPTELRARNRLHGAVELALGDSPSDAETALRALPAASGVERAGDRWIVLPRDARALAGQVTALIQQRQWKVNGLRVLEGRLDEVFKSLTVGDDLSRVG